MAKSNDWMPGARTEIIAMCRSWMLYMNAERRTAWGVPDAEYNALGSVSSDAESLLQQAMDEAERTHVITVKCQEAFKAAREKMRFFRDRYFKIPPLGAADWAALGFRPRDTSPTPAPRPDGVPAASLSYPGGPHALTVHVGPMVGTAELDPRSDHGYAVYVGIMPPGGATLEQAASKKHYLMEAPKDGEGLLHFRFTRRRKEKMLFAAEEGGMTAWVCCRYENRKGEAGQWGPVVSAVIP
jgi:hypothetical protein